jgi:signal peptide peptidase SppA
MSYSAIVRAVYGSVWAILPEKLEAIAAFLKMKLAGGMASPEVIAAIRADNEISAARAKSLAAGAPGAVAVLPLYGIINQRYAGDFSGPSGTSVQEFTQQFRQAMNDPNVKAIVIDVDSPGGTVSGVEELATEIYNGRKQKKITAVSNCLCASAAYWIASQANEVCVSPTSMTGSIGVYQLHEDDSEALAAMGVKVSLISAGKYKVEGNPYQPLDEEARGAMQGTVDDFYGMFTKAVARGRGVAVKAVAAGYGQGRVLTAPDAVKQGLADRIATLDEVLSKYGVKQPGSGSSAASPSTLLSASQMRAAEDDDTIIDPGDEDVSSAQCACGCEACEAGDCSACTNEACTGMAQGCKGCPIAVDGDEDESKAAAKSDAEARDRRLRLARA